MRDFFHQPYYKENPPNLLYMRVLSLDIQIPIEDRCLNPQNISWGSAFRGSCHTDPPRSVWIHKNLDFQKGVPLDSHDKPPNYYINQPNHVPRWYQHWKQISTPPKKGKTHQVWLEDLGCLGFDPVDDWNPVNHRLDVKNAIDNGINYPWTPKPWKMKVFEPLQYGL